MRTTMMAFGFVAIWLLVSLAGGRPIFDLVIGVLIVSKEIQTADDGNGLTVPLPLQASTDEVIE
jgi:hypothetical protein